MTPETDLTQNSVAKCDDESNGSDARLKALNLTKPTQCDVTLTEKRYTLLVRLGQVSYVYGLASAPLGDF